MREFCRHGSWDFLQKKITGTGTSQEDRRAASEEGLESDARGAESSFPFGDTEELAIDLVVMAAAAMTEKRGQENRERKMAMFL